MVTPTREKINIDELLDPAHANIRDEEKFCDNQRLPSCYSAKTTKHAITHKMQRGLGGEKKLPLKNYVCPMIGCSKNYPTYAKKMNHFRRRHLPSATEDRLKAQFYNQPSLESQQAATKDCKNSHSWNCVRVSYPRLL